MVSPYLEKPTRSEQAVIDFEAKRHRMRLGELLEWLEHNHLVATNAPGPDRYYNLRADRISAVKYAIEQLDDVAAKRILAQGKEAS